MNAITVEHVSKKFAKAQILQDISFKVKEKKCFGIIGENGAGKSTLLHLLCTVLNPTQGRILYKKFDTRTNGVEVRKLIGVVFQDYLLDEELTVYQNLNIHAMLYEFDTKKRRERIEQLLKIVKLSEYRDKKSGILSGGLKKRLEIARGLISQPKILFLDEPTLGLDPIAKKNILFYIKNLKKNMTIIITTNDIKEAEYLCDDIILLKNGRIITTLHCADAKTISKAFSRLES